MKEQDWERRRQVCWRGVRGRGREVAWCRRRRGRRRRRGSVECMVSWDGGRFGNWDGRGGGKEL